MVREGGGNGLVIVVCGMGGIKAWEVGVGVWRRVGGLGGWELKERAGI